MPFSRRPRAALLAVLLASAWSEAQVRAQAPSSELAPEPPLRMTWDSEDPACSGDDVSARALRMVSPGVVPRPLRARVEVRRDGDQWLVRLQTESGELSGRRILRAESCNELQQAIALLLAMAMESKGDVLSPEPPTAPIAVEPAPPPPPAAVIPVPETPAPENNVGDDRPTRDADSGGGIGVGWFVRIDGKAAYGLKPGLGLGVGVTGGIRLGDFDLGASAAHWPNTRAHAAARRGYMDLSRQDVSLRVCWNAWRVGDFTLAPCVAPELSFLRYEAKQVRVPRSDTLGPYPNVTAGVDLRYALVAENLSLLVSPGLTVGRVRPFEFGLDNGDSPANQPSEAEAEPEEIYRTKGFGPRLEVGVDARF